jgi:hypothetical protein
VNIHLPTDTLLNTLADNIMPVIAPSGDSNSESPRLPSVKPSLAFIPGIEATQIPNKRLEVANRKPTENADLFFTKEVKFLIMGEKRRCEPTIKLNSVRFLKKNNGD